MTDQDLHHMGNLERIHRGEYWFCWELVRYACGWAWRIINVLNNTVSGLENDLLREKHKVCEAKDLCQKNKIDYASRIEELERKLAYKEEEFRLTEQALTQEQNKSLKLISENNELRISLRERNGEAEREWQACRKGWSNAEDDNRKLRDSINSLKKTINNNQSAIAAIRQTLDEFERTGSHEGHN